MNRYAMSMNQVMLDSPLLEKSLEGNRFRNIEFSIGSLPTAETTRKNVTKLRKLVDQGMLNLASYHLPFAPFESLGVTDGNENSRKRAVQLLLENLSCFEGFGIREITIHCGGEPNSPETRPGKMRQMVRSCLEFQDILEKWGASLNLELLPRTCIGNHEDELLAMLEQLPEQSYNICLDVNHLMGRYAELPGIIKKCSSRLHSFHISDYDGVDECHWPVGHGIIDWAKVKAAIDAISRDVLIIVEINRLETWEPRRVNPALYFHSGEECCLRLEYAQDWEMKRKRLLGQPEN